MKENTAKKIGSLYYEVVNETEVGVGWDDNVAVPEFDSSKGVVGLDMNPDGIAICETDSNGNMIKTFYLKNDKIRFSKGDKRDYEISVLAKTIVEYAVSVKKPIVMENLKFNHKGKKRKKNKRSKRFNRMAHNFPYFKMKEMIVSRAAKNFVATKFVPAAYTSILGLIKYSDMYSLNRHTAASLIIARRGMGILERQNFDITEEEQILKKKSLTQQSQKCSEKKTETKVYILNSVGSENKHTLSVQSFQWLCVGKYTKRKPQLQTSHPHRINVFSSGSVSSPPEMLIGSMEGSSYSVGEIPTGKTMTTDSSLCLLKQRVNEEEGEITSMRICISFYKFLKSGNKIMKRKRL